MSRGGSLLQRRGSLLQKVVELINPVTGSWDEQLINKTFWNEDANIILALPLSQDVEEGGFLCKISLCTGNSS
jgi:hypothetical protein